MTSLHQSVNKRMLLILLFLNQTIGYHRISLV